MAKDDLNFNLDEFLASHSQGTKHMHSPKKKRAAQSPTRTAAQQKAAAKKQREAALKEASDTVESAQTAENQAVCDEQVQKYVQEQGNSETEREAVILHKTENDGVECEADDIFIPAAEYQAADFEKTQSDGPADSQQPTDQEPAASDMPDINIQSDKQADHWEFESLEDEISETQALETEILQSEISNIEEEPKAADSEDFFNKENEACGTLHSERVPAESKEENLPKYKERTSEISFAKKRLSDTASVGVRRLKEHEKSNAKIYSKPASEADKPTEEELYLQERLRRDRELTEKILRKAYEQEALSAELGIDKDISRENLQNSDNSQSAGKQKKALKSRRGRKAKSSDEKERALPVVQVGTTDEDNSQSIIDVLENALDEDVIELEYISRSHEETHSYEERPEKKSNKAQNFYFLVGLFFTVMSIIGIVVTAKSLLKFAKNISDDSKQKQEFAEYIYPVVVTDPASFESVNDLSDEAIIKAAIWDIIIYDDSSKYTHDASNNMYVPYIQVENHAKSLFGTTNIVHATVVFSEELTFFYDSESRMYKVPISPQLFPNTPVVREIDKVGERYTITVDYQEPTPNWELMNPDYTPGIKKTMEYILTKYNDGYTIISINNVE